jgi:putative pyruvate formate lyase activating enzyme
VKYGFPVEHGRLSVSLDRDQESVVQALPSYIRLHESGELAGRIEAARAILCDCTLCPRHCHVNRLEGERGVCRFGRIRGR